MSWFEWYMMAAVGVAAFLILGSAPMFQPAAQTTAVFDQLPARVDQIEDRLDLIEAGLARLLERQAIPSPD